VKYLRKTYGSTAESRGGFHKPDLAHNARLHARWSTDVFPAAKFESVVCRAEYERAGSYDGHVLHHLGSYDPFDLDGIRARLADARDLVVAAVCDPNSSLRREWDAMKLGTRVSDRHSPVVVARFPPPERPTMNTALERHLRSRGCVILQGPPGTGKTHAALEFVKYLSKGVSHDRTCWSTLIGGGQGKRCRGL
jgi:hypothetical protein